MCDASCLGNRTCCADFNTTCPHLHVAGQFVKYMHDEAFYNSRGKYTVDEKQTISSTDLSQSGLLSTITCSLNTHCVCLHMYCHLKTRFICCIKTDSVVGANIELNPDETHG